MSEPTTASIDDLLGAAEEPVRRPRRPRTGPRWWLGAILIAALGTVAIVFGLYLVSIGISAPVVFAGLLALQLLIRVTRQVTPPTDAPAGPDLAPLAQESSDLDDRDALRRSVGRWELRLSWSKGERDRFARVAWPRIGEIADERLRQRHGLTRASDPRRARDLLGEAVWEFLATPPKRTPSPRQLAAIVAELERL